MEDYLVPEDCEYYFLKRVDGQFDTGGIAAFQKEGMSVGLVKGYDFESRRLVIPRDPPGSSTCLALQSIYSALGGRDGYDNNVFRVRKMDFLDVEQLMKEIIPMNGSLEDSVDDAEERRTA